MCMAESLFAHETSLWFCLSSDRIRAKLFTPHEIIYIGFLSPGFSGCPNDLQVSRLCVLSFHGIVGLNQSGFVRASR
jgi:hypothetical protein